MLFRKFVSEGLAHNSYLIGSNGRAVVIDPRRDIDIYLTTLKQTGYRLERILETHRNEDYVIGSTELSRQTDAEIFHADPEFEYRYGNAAEDGMTWQLGEFTLHAISTPGHTPGHMSYLLVTGEGEPWMLFSGDALFAGDSGRVDLMGNDRMREMAGLLYDSLYKRILPLGDGVILQPAHGAGSVCGSSIAEREPTTLGIEKKLNPNLRYGSREAFIDGVAREQERPPYFRKMEELNTNPPADPLLPNPPALAPDEFAAGAESAIILDTRDEVSYCGAHIPASLSIWNEGVPSFAGWFLPYDTAIYLVNDGSNPDETIRMLYRIGYSNIGGYLAGGFEAWAAAGRPAESFSLLPIAEVRKPDDGFWLLDVRGRDELETDGMVPHARNIHLTRLQEHLDELPTDREIAIFCGTGHRATTAASIMARRGLRNTSVVLGGFSGWSASSAPVA